MKILIIIIKNICLIKVEILHIFSTIVILHQILILLLWEIKKFIKVAPKILYPFLQMFLVEIIVVIK